MEYNIIDFTTKLKEWFVSSPLFPKMTGTYKSGWGYMQTDEEKHPNRNPVHLDEAVRQCFDQTTSTSENTISFDLGSETMEHSHPYYHILEDSPVIRKKYRGTEKTKGSQAQIKDVGKRDYGRVEWNGKTFTKEYSRNVRGSRNRIESVSHWAVDSNGRKYFANRESNSYQNVYYRYIENILDQDVVMKLASEFNLTTKRKIDTGFAEEYSMQPESQYTTDIISILMSHD